MFCGSRQIVFGGRGGKMALLIVKVANTCRSANNIIALSRNYKGTF